MAQQWLKNSYNTFKLLLVIKVEEIIKSKNTKILISLQKRHFLFVLIFGLRFFLNAVFICLMFLLYVSL